MRTATVERAVNGGLIDFQDNVIRADMSSAIFASQAQACHPMHAAGLSMAYQPMPAIQAMHAMPMQSGYQAGLPGLASNCIAGPPAYFHVNGQVYRPAETEIATHSADAGMEKRAAKQSIEQVQRNLEQQVQRNIQAKLQEFERRNRFSAPTSTKPREGRRTGKRGDSLQQQKRIENLNSSMHKSLQRKL